MKSIPIVFIAIAIESVEYIPLLLNIVSISINKLSLISYVIGQYLDTPINMYYI